MKFQILKLLALLNAAASVSATTAAGAPPISNLNRAHGTNDGSVSMVLGLELVALFKAGSIGLFDFSFFVCTNSWRISFFPNFFGWLVARDMKLNNHNLISNVKKIQLWKRRP
jgi:hypothetical protein